VDWVRSPHRAGWGQLGARQVIKSGGFTTFFTPSGIAPLGGTFARIMTIHDLGFMRHPRAYSRIQLLKMRGLMRQSARRCEMLIVPSEAVKADLMRYWKIPAQNIVVIPHGPLLLSAHPEPLPGLGDVPFILCLGRVETKKNIGTLVRAFAGLATYHADLHLVLAGGDGVGAADVRHIVGQLPKPIQKRIVFTGYCTSEQQSWLYTHARAVTVPCADEGFGFPVLEAMEAGTPLVVADAGAAPEVAGDAALKASSHDPAAWQALLEQLLANQVVRQNLIEAGKKRLQDFSWEKAAQATAAVLLQ
jgi:glycosyltransferase involved in cell wall biosynthesis